MADPLSVLETEFCPPLEPALVYAIYHDFEGSEEQILKQAREVLEPIKANALAEQYLDFDASGSATLRHTTEYTLSDPGGASTESGITTISSGVSSSDGTPEHERANFFGEFEQFDTSTKEARLSETFPTLNISKISYTLKKCGNNFERATDELLNQVYFEGTTGDEQVATKSVDAFFDDDDMQVRRRKKKGKKARRGNQYLGPSADASPTASEATRSNKWETGLDAIGFISTRTNLSRTTVSSAYHQAGASVPATIQALLEANTKVHAEDNINTAPGLESALELVDEFQTITIYHAIALIRLTHPSTAAAHELAKALTRPSTPPTGGIQIVQHYAPIDLSEATTPLSPSSGSSRTTNQSTSSLGSARSAAFQSASSAWRKGRSDPLMRAAAGYYGQVGRDYDSAFKAARSADADSLVATQSTPTSLDLHGVSVKDATRITREKVTSWWHELGDTKYGRGERPGVGSGFRVITGKGSHSQGGRGKLGPAVGAMLVREGWKVEIGSGTLVVTGVTKRR
ncbi:hypothetical protein EJ05DRAFT_478670 [Pseudovirgaria hyperparasitica]|uniref:Smr domain-containing protein n=1 Tax=Pseudovirgaria hyperparasitica TaxID=470096 RepID=A0A6A6VYJ9_9PEZI|nr:uncharacterized protein EJ05DRAFT_478670 [Pseudovirgaria hyperparasitica]KAF2755712.1 hypothetical protein EJ05DRAFT_478670 [Pseudovirgaria hyperparasitica]